MNGLKMNSSNLLKGGVVVVLMLAALAAFDSFGSSGYVGSPITGAQTAVKATCPASITVSTGGFTDYKQGETITFIIKVLDAKGNILKTGAGVEVIAGEFETNNIVLRKSVSLKATASGEISHKFPLDADFVKSMTKANVWVNAIATSEMSGCGKIQSPTLILKVYKIEPDFAVEESTLYYEENGVKTYRAAIANQGAAMSSSFNVVARIKRQGYSTSIAGTTLKSLGAAEKQNFVFSLKPEALQCGDNTVEVAVDPDGAVAAETIKGNNVKSITVKKDCTSSGSESGSVDSGTAAGAVGGTSQQAAQPAQKAASYKKTLYTGWNLVGLDVLSNVVSTTCGGFPPKLSTVIYEFDPEKQDYVLHTLENDPANNIIKLTDSVVLTRVAWVYKRDEGEPCEIQSYIASRDSAVQATPRPQWASVGWNLVTIPQDWIGKTPRQAFTNECNFYSTAWYHDAGAQKYVEWAVSSTNAFSSQDVDKAFWLYAESCYS